MFSSNFSASVEMIIWLFFSLLLRWIIVTDLKKMNLKFILHSQDKPIWTWYIIPFVYCQIQFFNSMLKIFISTSVRNIGLQFSYVFVWFWYQGKAGLVKWFGKSSSFSIFRKSLYGIGTISSLDAAVSTVKLSRHGVFFSRRLFLKGGIIDT